MAAAVLTVSEVNQNFSRARKALKEGPVIITDHGAPAMVLMTYEAFAQRNGARASFLERIDVPGTEEIDFEPSRLRPGLFRPADLG